MGESFSAAKSRNVDLRLRDYFVVMQQQQAILQRVCLLLTNNRHILTQSKQLSWFLTHEASRILFRYRSRHGCARLDLFGNHHGIMIAHGRATRAKRPIGGSHQ
jgi:hypothetical protein